MKKGFYNVLKSLCMLIAAFSLLALVPVAALAAPIDQIQEGIDAAGGGGGGPTVEEVVQTVANILIFIVGLIAVIMVIIGAIKYTTSNGDQSAISSAKNTILYAVVGIILAIASFGIVNFVVDQF